MGTFLQEAYRNIGRGTKAQPAGLKGMLVYPQRNNWSCGPMALRYCLMKWRVDVDDRKIAKLASSTRGGGTSDRKMGHAAWRLGARYNSHNQRTAKAAKLTIDRLLTRGLPLILCIEKWQHWVACLHHGRGGYLIFDSSRPGPVIQVRSWKWVKQQMWFTSKTDPVPIYAIASVSRPVQRARRRP
jgi:ABC-type bacteriocin/lantibiotic exporter with double-glycine peptidase domain